jgi:exodeoxyribonuclease VII small subunit
VAKQEATPENSPDAQPTFEESLQRLEQIVRQLEQGQLGLSESLECYEEGIKHLKGCYRALESAERKIELLAGVDAEGRPVTQPFDDAETTLDEKAQTRSRRRSRPAGSESSQHGDGTAPGTLF